MPAATITLYNLNTSQLILYITKKHTNDRLKDSSIFQNAKKLQDRPEAFCELKYIIIHSDHLLKDEYCKNCDTKDEIKNILTEIPKQPSIGDKDNKSALNDNTHLRHFGDFCVYNEYASVQNNDLTKFYTPNINATQLLMDTPVVDKNGAIKNYTSILIPYNCISISMYATLSSDVEENNYKYYIKKDNHDKWEISEKTVEMTAVITACVLLKTILGYNNCIHDGKYTGVSDPNIDVVGGDKPYYFRKSFITTEVNKRVKRHYDGKYKINGEEKCYACPGVKGWNTSPLIDPITNTPTENNEDTWKSFITKVNDYCILILENLRTPITNEEYTAMGGNSVENANSDNQLSTAIISGDHRLRRRQQPSPPVVKNLSFLNTWKAFHDIALEIGTGYATTYDIMGIEDYVSNRITGTSHLDYIYKRLQVAGTSKFDMFDAWFDGFNTLNVVNLGKLLCSDEYEVNIDLLKMTLSSIPSDEANIPSPIEFNDNIPRIITNHEIFVNSQTFAAMAIEHYTPYNNSLNPDRTDTDNRIKFGKRVAHVTPHYNRKYTRLLGLTKNDDYEPNSLYCTDFIDEKYLNDYQNSLIGEFELAKQHAEYNGITEPSSDNKRPDKKDNYTDTIVVLSDFMMLNKDYDIVEQAETVKQIKQKINSRTKFLVRLKGLNYSLHRGMFIGLALFSNDPNIKNEQLQYYRRNGINLNVAYYNTNDVSVPLDASGIYYINKVIYLYDPYNLCEVDSFDKILDNQHKALDASLNDTNKVAPKNIQDISITHGMHRIHHYLELIPKISRQIKIDDQDMYKILYDKLDIALQEQKNDTGVTSITEQQPQEEQETPAVENNSQNNKPYYYDPVRSATQAKNSSGAST